MITKRIERKHLRLRAAVIKRIAKTVERDGATFGANTNLTLPAHVVIDSATEEHIRHISGLVVGQKKDLQAIVFDNYDESYRTYPVSEFNTETLLGVLAII